MTTGARVRYGPAVVELVGDSSQGGDFAWIVLRVDDGRIAHAHGEGEGVRELCRAVSGLSVLDAGGIPGNHLAVDALHHALGGAVAAAPAPGRVAVAMSGGVDSAVALLRARAAGLEPVGVTLRLWADPGGPDSDRACCSPASVVAARETCHSLGIRHFTLDLREDFRRRVVSQFVDGYASGETPNPCVRCNGAFRFHELFSFAHRIGAQRVVTGHYARVSERSGRLLLARGVDREKDQSYMLGLLDPRFLGRVWFPLGDQTKVETREEAHAAGLAAAGRAESQEACFLAGSDYRDFLARHGVRSHEGPVLDEQGRELGRHKGFWRFTPGQRRGLGVAGGEPLYALRTDPSTNAVVVGPRDSLARTVVEARGGRLFVPVSHAEAKLRYRSAPHSATVIPFDGGFRLGLAEPAYGVAPGQAAVLYDDDVVVGAGLVSAAK